MDIGNRKNTFFVLLTTLLSACATTPVAVRPLTIEESRVRIVRSDANVTQWLKKNCKRKSTVMTFNSDYGIRIGTVAQGGNFAQIVYGSSQTSQNNYSSWSSTTYDIVAWLCPARAERSL